MKMDARYVNGMRNCGDFNICTAAKTTTAGHDDGDEGQPGQCVYG